MLEPAKWLKLLRGRVNVRRIAKVVVSRTAARGIGFVRNVRRFVGVPAAEDLGAELDRVVAGRTGLRFAFSVGDPGEALLRVGAGWALPRLERRGSLMIVRLPGCDHSLSATWMHEVLWREFLPGIEGR